MRGVTGPTKNLQCLVRAAVRHLRGKILNHGRLLVTPLPGVDAMTDVVHQLSCCLYFRRDGCQLETNRLEIRDRPTELNAVLGILHSNIERPLCLSNGTRRRVCARGFQRAGQVIERFPLFPE